MPEEIIHFDENGKPYVLDEAGNRRPPMQSQPINDGEDFVEYDTSEGHCGLCGKLTCNGWCFK